MCCKLRVKVVLHFNKSKQIYGNKPDVEKEIKVAFVLPFILYEFETHGVD